MRIKNRKRFIVSMSLIFMLLFLIVSLFTNKVFSHEEPKYEKVIVSNGDTLWSIASSLNGNINKNIYNIREVNGLVKSDIYVGQELLIPLN